MSPVITWSIGYYVVDEVGQLGPIAGPFEYPSQAEAELRSINIADDCGVWHRDKNGQFEPYPGYSLEAGR